MRDILIAGLGLIGGSIGKALRRRGWRVRFLDPAVSSEEARQSGAADEKAESFDLAELILLATPIDVALDQLERLQSSRALVTTTCSVMRPVREHAGRLRLVAGHPFAGSEQSGLPVADVALFEGRPWFIDRPDEQISQVIRECGAQPVTVDPFHHDETLALTSHLPQVIATALGSILAGADPTFVGSGAHSLLRLSGSSHELWGPTLEHNRANVERAIEQLCVTMRGLSEPEFERAQRFYRTIPASASRPER
ncbi:MAG TPA: prephenate dehydrogenase/arogenate dehydrogenase family protein [Thermoanaerobaculia bacterium]|nr:prephenate dehydrogenase/arogenate dehydrogenase family protein [Thermoanaerobaculia bacterium]